MAITATTSTLSFTQTMQISQFKAKNNITKIDIIKNPNTGKLFFSAGDITGAVSDNYAANPVISLMVDKETGESFLLIHKQGDSNVVDSL